MLIMPTQNKTKVGKHENDRVRTVSGWRSSWRFLRYIMVASPKTIGGLPVNVLAVNVIGSFILGLFSVLSLALNLDSNYTLLVATGFLRGIHNHVLVCS